jgi:hypothetical protein
MTFAPLYVIWRSAINRGKQQATDIRYLVAGSVVAGYVIWLSVRPAARGLAGDGGELTVVGGMLLFLMSAIAWWQGAERLAVAPAARQWLIAAPVRDRDVLLFKLTGLQGRIALSALILVSAARSETGVLMALHFLAIVVMLNTLECHRLVAAVVRSRQQEAERSAAFAVWLVRTFFLLVCAALAFTVGRALLSAPLVSVGAAGRAVFSAVSASPLASGFGAFLVFVRPAFSSGATEWARAMAVPLIVLVLHLAWLANARIAWSVRDATARWRAPALRPALAGAETTAVARWLARYPTTALLWKNLRTASRTQRLDAQVALAIGIPVLLSLTSLRPFRPLTEFACGAAAMWAALLVIAGPLFVRCDLRLDLPRLRVLRTWPVTSAEICAAEIGASAIVLSGVQLCLLALGLVSLSFNPVVNIPPQLQLALVITMIVVLPGMNLAHVGAHVLTAILFPTWGPLGVVSRERSSGVGYFYLGVVASLVAFVTLGLLPAVAGATAGFSVMPLVGGTVALILGALLASAVACAEGVLLMRVAAQALGKFEFVRE